MNVLSLRTVTPPPSAEDFFTVYMATRTSTTGFITISKKNTNDIAKSAHYLFAPLIHKDQKVGTIYANIIYEDEGIRFMYIIYGLARFYDLCMGSE